MKSFKLLLLHCLPAAAVPIILAATAVASTGLAVAQTVMAPKPPEPPELPQIPQVPTAPTPPTQQEVATPQHQSIQQHERSTLRERRQKRTQNIFTSPLGAPIKSSVKSLLGQ